jgi:nucleotide-binding universal stress UspA family protein
VTAAVLFTKIVCGVDGSPQAFEAVKQARRLAGADAQITLVSVSESHLAMHTGWSAPEWTERLKERAEDALDEARKLVPGADTVLLHGRAADAFVRAVGDERATLAAVGSREISRTLGTLIGSVATRILHEGVCSVLVARAADWPWPRSIVVGLDGSDESLAAAVVAHDVAARTGSTVRLLVARGASPDDIATDALARFGYDVAFSDEKPVPALLEAAQDADLLVLGSRGVTGLRRLGSVSERVAHRAPCSLLVVRGLVAPDDDSRRH